jgi:quercetin dioxygenase-like cupin family protein
LRDVVIYAIQRGASMANSEEAMHEYVKEGLQLEDLIDYQHKSVVSKTIISEPSGTVTLFAFDRGEELSEHTAPFDALVYVVDGSVEITISGNVYHLKRGEVMMMPANRPHAVHAVESFKMLLIMVKSLEQ